MNHYVLYGNAMVIFLSPTYTCAIFTYDLCTTKGGGERLGTMLHQSQGKVFVFTISAYCEHEEVFFSVMAKKVKHYCYGGLYLT